MSSQASWQTGGGILGGAGGGEDLTDRQAIENLLHRLVQQVEETERRYNDALNELQARLDQLAHKTDAAKAASLTDDAAAFAPLHDRVSGLARRLETEATTSLENFERLGRAVMGGLDRGATGFASGPFVTPFSSPLAAEQPGPSATPFTFPPPFAPEPFEADRPSFAFPAPEPQFPPFPPLPDTDRDLSKRLVNMAHRLEHSVDAAMSPKRLDDLDARIDAIGRQIADALAATPKSFSPEPLERQIADVARQLGQAEAELAKIGAIETALQRLIERLDGQAGQLSEVAAKAATEAARLVSGEAPLEAATAERLDSMHSDLKAMSARSSAADDRLAGIIEAVHDSLKQLVQQVDRSAARATALRSRAPSTERTPNEPSERFGTDPETNSDSKAVGSSNGGDGETASGAKRSSLESGFAAPLPGIEKSATRPPFGRANRAVSADKAVDLDEDKPAVFAAQRSSRILVKKVARTTSEMEDDLVAAARRAAHAAALRAAERKGEARRKWMPSGPRVEMPRAETRRVETEGSEARLRRRRPLLIVCAAVLLALSAILLYSRLQTKPWSALLPPSAEESAPRPPAPTENDPLPGRSEKAPAAAAEPGNETPPGPGASGIVRDAASNAADNSSGGDDENFTDIAKSSYWPATVMAEPAPAEPASGTEEATGPQPAALHVTEEPALPPGVVFAIEDPSRGF